MLAFHEQQSGRGTEQQRTRIQQITRILWDNGLKLKDKILFSKDKKTLTNSLMISLQVEYPIAGIIRAQKNVAVRSTNMVVKLRKKFWIFISLKSICSGLCATL